MRLGNAVLKVGIAIAVLTTFCFQQNALGQQVEASSRITVAASDVPGAAPVILPPIAPDEAEKLIAGRVDSGDQNEGLKPVIAKGSTKGGNREGAALAVPAPPIPASTAELARALKYDPVLIYEFVRNNIEYLPVWGILKGPEGAITDGMGTSFDIAQLTADLINADPVHGATATLVRGTITMPAATAASWLSLNGMNVCPLAYTFSSGGIPTGYSVSGFPDCRGSPATVTVGHVWVKVTIGAATYEIDPSFKTHTQIFPIVDLPTVTGYSRSSFLAAACTNCNTNPNIVTALNRSSILNAANAQSYPKFARNLLFHLQTNNIHDLSKVIGGYKIDSVYPNSLPSSLPYTVASRIADPFTIDGTWKSALLVNFNGISQLFSSDAIYGKRLTVTFNGSNFPQLNLDGTVVQTGATAVSPETYGSVNLSMCLPFSGINCSVATVDGSGKALWCNNTSPVRCTTASVLSGGTYAVTNSWGPINNAMVDRHRIASIRATNAGVSPTAEANLGEVLTTQGFNYSAQSALYQSLSVDGQRNGGYDYYIIGISGHTGSGGGPYIDLPGIVRFSGVKTALNSDGTYSYASRLDNFLDVAGQGSVYESTSVNQLSGISSISTAKLIDIGVSQTTNNNVYDFKNCSDYNTYNGSLVSYAASVKTAVQNLVCSKSYRVILPQRGNLTDPAITTSPKWTGAGYYGFPSSGTGSYPAIISGGYAGGYSGAQQTPTNTVLSADIGNDIIVTARSRGPTTAPDAGSGGIFGWINSNIIQPVKRAVSDPVDQVTGAFLSQTSDISIGEMGLPRMLSFERGYTTSDISASSPMGQGWKNSFDISAQTSSDGVRAGGAYDAWDAAEMLAVKMVNRDLMSDPSLPAVNIAVAAIGNRWLGDRLVNNVVVVDGGTVATVFHRLADDGYNPGQYSTTRLAGIPSAWTMRSANGTSFAFNAVDTNLLARIGTITQPSGIVTTFGYTSGQLSQVTNNLGRRLNLTWTGGRVSGVTDTPLLGATQRTVSFTYSGNLLQQVTDTRLGRTLYCYDALGRMTSYYLPTEGSGTNCAAAGAHITNVYDTLGRVKQQTDGAGHVTDLYLAGTRSEVVTHPGSGVADIRAINYLDNFGNVTRQISPRTGLATTYTYDALSRFVRTNFPEGNAVEIAYDLRSNPIRSCNIAKTAGTYPACNTGTGSTDIWTTTSYGEGEGVWTCSTINTCNKPVSMTDPLGNVTTYSYKTDGQIDTVTLPTPTGYAGAPKTVYAYAAYAGTTGTINLLDTVTATATAGSPPSIVTKFGYDTAVNGRSLLTQTLDPTGLNYVTTYGHDGYGNRTTAKGPRTDVNDTVTTAYNADRNPVTITYPNPGTGSPITQIAYNANGWPTATARKLGANWMVDCTTYTASGQVATRFGPYKTASATDCGFAGNTAVPKATLGYDGADRLVTTTVAENAGDRVARLALFPDNRMQTATRAFGSPGAATETYAYSNNGLPVSVTDARGNVSALAYDGFDRLSQMKYPLAAGGGPSASDLVAFAYDKRGAMTRRSIRGTGAVSASCTQCIAFGYDAIGRLTQKTVPTIAANTAVFPTLAAVPGYSVYYHYDLIGRLDQQGYNAGSPELTFAYDNAGRVTAAKQYGRTLGYSYGTPAQGLSRTLVWPGSAGFVLACSDALGRVVQLKEAADCSTITGRLVAYGYDDVSRRVSATRPSGATTSYTYEDTGALDTLGHALAGGSAVNYAFSYNRALQIATRSTDNDLYAWTNNYNVTRAYAANGLDQYGRIMGDTQVWDGRGNLAAYRGSSWGYDGENRLAAVNLPAGTVTTGYDPAGRLRQIGAAATTQLLYDGAQLVAEYDAAGGALTARYVPGPGMNETALGYDGAGVKSWYHQDAQGSVVATSDGAGNAVTIDQYGPYGEPGIVYQGRNQGRIRYTGQAIISEAGDRTGINQILYDYKARIYAPKLGRFLQTDPIGAQDDRNLYAYVRNDPVNRGDPSGLAAEATAGVIQGGLDALYSIFPPSASWRPSNTGSPAYMEGYNAAPRVLGETAFGLATMGVGAEVGTARSLLTQGSEIGTTTVGRWMSQTEFSIMSQTGKVVEGAGGRTYVVNPANPAAYTSAAPGSVYAEFNVPTSVLQPGGNPAWSQIPGPNITTHRFGPAPAELAPATCIVCVIDK